MDRYLITDTGRLAIVELTTVELTTGEAGSAGAVVIGRGVAGRAVAVAGYHVEHQDGPADGDRKTQDNGDDHPDHDTSPSGWIYGA
jgi:hypothetical protein